MRGWGSGGEDRWLSRGQGRGGGGGSTECRVLSTEGEAGDAELHGPAGTLVPTGANGIRERLGVGGWRLGRGGKR